MTTKNAIEAAKITKELKNFTLDVENFAIPQGFAIRHPSRMPDNPSYYAPQ